MSFAATVYKVLIASPSDVREARGEVETAIHQWNTHNAENHSAILLPWRWEDGGIPLLGDSPQNILNDQGVKSADIVIALFGTRLGAPTTNYDSGTVEEILESLKNDKRVHVYFSDRSVELSQIDIKQLVSLQAFKERLGELGLYDSFDSLENLNKKVLNAVNKDVWDLRETSTQKSSDRRAPEQELNAHFSLEGEGANLSAATNGLDKNQVEFRVQPRNEREFKGTDKRGKAQYRLRNWIEVENIGGRDAEDVTFAAQIDEGRFMRLMVPENPITIQSGSKRELPVQYSAAGKSGAKVTIQWSCDGQMEEKTFNVE